MITMFQKFFNYISKYAQVNGKLFMQPFYNSATDPYYPFSVLKDRGLTFHSAFA